MKHIFRCIYFGFGVNSYLIYFNIVFLRDIELFLVPKSNFMKYLFTICAFLTLSCFANEVSAQLKVGRSKDEIAADKKKATPQLIGANNLLSSEFKLFRLGDSTEIFWYITDKKGKGQFTFDAPSDEKDFYEYVLGLFDDFKDNEFNIGKTRIVPLKMGNFVGTKNLAFDINPDGQSYADKTLIIGKAGWIRMFKKSIIHNL